MIAEKHKLFLSFLFLSVNTTAHRIRFSGTFPGLRPLLDGFVDVLIRAHHPHIILAVYLQQLDVSMHGFIG